MKKKNLTRAYMQFISARLLHSAFTRLHARTAEKMAETQIISNLHPPLKKKLKGSYDAISSFPFSLECYNLFVHR